MLRIIREVQPTWVVGENVFGLISWNGGLVFDEVQTDLEAEGYELCFDGQCYPLSHLFDQISTIETIVIEACER